MGARSTFAWCHGRAPSACVVIEHTRYDGLSDGSIAGVIVVHISDTVEALDAQLPGFARHVIEHHLDLSDPANQSFLEFPDAREQHQTQWHQWGIITHTRVFLRLFRKDVPHLLKEWGVWEGVDGILSVGVGGQPKWDLLQITILLHDIGKFAARSRSRQRFHFNRHEALSGHIIRAELDLTRFGLTQSQIEYVALTAEDHFVLGLLRKRAREQARYDLSFVRSPTFAALAREIKQGHPQDFTEIGVLFLGDSLAKADPRTGPERAVSQNAVNVAVARRYLEIVLEKGSL